MTKRLFIAMALVAMTFTACERADGEKDVTVEVDTGEWKEEKKFTFTIKGDFINPEFSEGANKAMRKAAGNQYMTADGTEMTDLWVVDVVSGEVKQTLHQTSADADWGAPKMSLTLGTHHVMFLASRGQNPTYTNGIVTWTRPNDTFYLDYEVTVVKTSNGNRAVTLDRVATRMSLVIEDAIPAGTTSVIITPETWYNGWNMLTAAPVDADGYVSRYDLPQSWVGTTGSTLNMWGLSSADEWQTNVTISSKAGETTNASALIEDAPFRANRVTKYSGNLYSNAENSSVSLNATWLTQYEGVY